MSATDQETYWLERVEDLFLRFGIKSQTMDDVSRELGISKKTLYQMVSNKDELVRKVLEHHISREKSNCMNATEAANAIEEILMMTEANSQELSQMKANVLYDLQKYHREGWLLIQKFHYDFVYKMVCNNIARGRSEGLYREDFDADLIAKLHLTTVFQLFDEELFPSSTISREIVFREYMMHYLHGIVSKEGLKFLQSKLQ